MLTLADAKSHGQRAIDLLGSRLPEVAAWYRKSPEQLRAMLRSDRLLKVDRQGRLFVEEELTAPLASTAPAAAPAGVLDGSLAPLDQTFLLHSKPGSKRTIYLNFRGAVLTNTAWNSSGSTITALPFDLDGVPYSFSNTELQTIQYIWQRVVEDFAPFDVDVTTEAPAADAITRSSATDEVYGTTALITSRSGVYNCSCGGVAYIGVFDYTGDYYKPALVFWDALGRNEKNIAEAISHEVGHNGGLNHDGWPGGSYYEGHGSGATGWAPIMGVGYYRSLVQWSKGQYSGANNAEDDHAVMASNGLAARADDHGGTLATATALAGTVSNGTLGLLANGIIERPGDVDMLSFYAGAGAASFTLAGAARSSNLDALVELRNAAGQLLASGNPADALNTTLSTTLPAAGTYYLSVTGTGKGDPLNGGYSNYGSLGHWALAASVVAPSGVPPVAQLAATPATGTVPLSVNFSSAGSNDPDGSIVAYEWLFGDGTTATGASASKVYTTAGSYTAQLRVTDNSGLTSTKAVTITANPVVAMPTMSVATIAMSLRTQKNRNARATAVVSVRDANGNALPGATVSGSWSGVVTGSASGISGSNGSASLNSAQTRNSGTFTFTVTGITLSGYSYTPAANGETSDSITR
jgi:PKD repeat protein